MSIIKKRASLFSIKRKVRGKLVLSQVKSFSCYQENSREKTCTTARNFIRNNNICPPCIINVAKALGKNDKFLFSKTGLFDYRYAVINHKLLLQITASSSAILRLLTSSHACQLGRLKQFVNKNIE